MIFSDWNYKIKEHNVSQNKFFSIREKIIKEVIDYNDDLVEFLYIPRVL